jgi:hypothetical protein
LAEYEHLLGPLGPIDRGDLVVDAGAGQAVAALELARQGATVVAINGQDSFTPFQGAPENLPRIADLIDSGAFTYKVGHVENVCQRQPHSGRLGGICLLAGTVDLLSSYYDALAPDGMAKILFHPAKAESRVEAPEGVVDLHKYLQDRYPTIFTSEPSPSLDPNDLFREFQSCVVTVRRDPDIANLDLPLEVDQIAFDSHDRPHIRYSEVAR